MKISVINSSYHFQRSLAQFILSLIVFYGLVGRYEELWQLYFILTTVSLAAIFCSTFIVIRSKHLISSLTVNLLAAGVFFIAGNLLVDFLTWEVIENVKLEPEGADKTAKVVAAKVFDYSGWEFLWIYLINAVLAHISLGGNTSSDDKASDFSEEVFKVRLGNKVHFIPYREIEFIEASGNYVHVHSHNKKYTSRIAIQDILKKSNKAYLMRIHRSFVINVNLIKELIPAGEGHSVVLTSGSEIKIGKNYRAALFEHLGL